MQVYPRPDGQLHIPARSRSVALGLFDGLHPGHRQVILAATQTAHDDESRTLPPAFQALYAVLHFEDRGKVYEWIEQRVDRMCREGLFEETARLLESGVSPDSTCMQAIGYRQAAWALRGEMPRDEAIALIKQATRRYAKRQLTWFRRHDEAFWLPADRLTTEEQADRIEKTFTEGGDTHDAG